MISIEKKIKEIPNILLSNKKEAWKHESVLETLKTLYHSKCAYCEQKTEELQINHYRPIKNYPWLENEWSNLLPACPTCNKSKSDNFPIKGRRILEAPKDALNYRADSKLLRSEEPILIHPEVDTAENHFYFEVNGLIQGHTDRGRKTISILNLYREDLTQKRKLIYERFFNQLFERILGRNKEGNFYIDLVESTTKKSEFSTFGQQIFYQFESFIYKSVIDKIEVNKYKIFAEDIKDFSEEKLDNIDSIDFYGLAAEYELNEYYQKVFKLQYQNWLHLDNPLSIIGFSIRTFQGIKKLSIDNIPLNTQWIFLTGENGFGKTSILKAILLGLIGTSEFKENEIDENARIELKIAQKERKVFSIIDENKIKYNILGSNFFIEYKGSIAAYGSKRTEFIPDASKLGVSDNLFERTHQVLNTEQLLKTLEGNKELEGFKAIIIEAFLKLIPRLSKIEFTPNESRTSKEILYFEKDEFDNELPPVTFDQLAMGMRSIIGLVGDIVQRLSENRGFRLKKYKKSRFNTFRRFSTLSDLSGVVIIDEFDNHLHPAWQRMLVKKLTELFPKVQFIVATHSPIALLGAPPKKTVILKVNRTQKEGITVQRLEKIEKELPNLLPNVLLTSPVFGLSSIKSEYNESIDDLNVDDNYKDQERYDRLDKEIDAFFK